MIIYLQCCFVQISFCLSTSSFLPWRGWCQIKPSSLHTGLLQLPFFLAMVKGRKWVYVSSLKVLSVSSLNSTSFPFSDKHLLYVYSSLGNSVTIVYSSDSVLTRWSWVHFAAGQNKNISWPQILAWPSLKWVSGKSWESKDSWHNIGNTIHQTH